MNNNILIIAGMHRSETSLLSQWLNRCGLNLGEQLLGANIGNIEGHFEDVDFYRFHEDTLESNHLPKSGLIASTVPELSTYQKEKLKSIISFKNKMNRQWGWKDPRICLFLAHYRELIPDAYYLNIIRDYKSTVSSLISRDFKCYESKYLTRNWLLKGIWKNLRRGKKLRKFYLEQSEYYLNVWITYNEELLKNIQNLPDDRFMVVDHQKLYEDDKYIFSKLKNTWNFSLKYYDFKKIFKENLLSRVIDIDPFIKDKTLLEKAQNLQKELKKYVYEECTIKKLAPVYTMRPRSAESKRIPVARAN
jgi:hypothetical protein